MKHCGCSLYHPPLTKPPGIMNSFPFSVKHSVLPTSLLNAQPSRLLSALPTRLGTHWLNYVLTKSQFVPSMICTVVAGVVIK